MVIRKKDDGLPDYAMVERRQLTRGLGYGEQPMARLQIGVVSSWGEINPAAVGIDKVSEAVKAGVWSAGATPREFVICSICTSMAGDDRYHLPHRDLVAGYIEAVARTTLLDGLVLLWVCDDVIPAHLMAAARLDIPAVVVTGGYMNLNRYRGEPVEPLDVAPKHHAAFKEGRIDGHHFQQIQERGCAGTGACPVIGTANTMSAMTEALGMSLPGNTTTPGADSRLKRLAFAAGSKVVELHGAGIRPSHVMTLAAFHNAIRLLMAIGGSTNAVLHLQAAAAELGLEIDMAIFNELSRKTPLICDVAPSGKKLLADLDEAGGLEALMKELEPLLDTSLVTVTGGSLAENLKAVRPGDRSVVRPLDDPLEAQGGLVVLRGNLAPGGCPYQAIGGAASDAPPPRAGADLCNRGSSLCGTERGSSRSGRRRRGPLRGPQGGSGDATAAALSVAARRQGVSRPDRVPVGRQVLGHHPGAAPSGTWRRRPPQVGRLRCSRRETSSRSTCPGRGSRCWFRRRSSRRVGRHGRHRPRRPTGGTWRCTSARRVRPSAVRLSTTRGDASATRLLGEAVRQQQEGVGDRQDPDRYPYDPLDLMAPEENSSHPPNILNPNWLSDGIGAHEPNFLIDHSPPLGRGIDVAGAPVFRASIELNGPDTDFHVRLSEVRPDGTVIWLGETYARARYRNSRNRAKLVAPGTVQLYEFKDFLFLARRIPEGSRLRLILSGLNRPDYQKNYNSGGDIAWETAKDARTAIVKLHHDERHPSAVELPVWK